MSACDDGEDVESKALSRRQCIPGRSAVSGLRVVKQVRWSQRRSFLTELQVMGRVSKVLALLQLYMLLDTDFYCSAAGKEILRSVPRLVPVQ